MPKLTLKEQRWLDHPPTPETWECLRKLKVVTEWQEYERECHTINAGSKSECWLCRQTRGKRHSRIVWDDFMDAVWKLKINLDRDARRGVK